MSRRISSLNNSAVGVERDIGSEYDNIKLVADNLDAVLAANSSAATIAASVATVAEDAASAAASAASITGMLVDATTLAPGSLATASWDGTTLTINVPRGDVGPQGIQGEVGNITAVVRETFIATAGQTLITLDNPYVLSSNALSVYVNGARYTDADFSETSTISITMTVGLTMGDEVLVENGSLVSTNSVIVATIVATLPDTPDANTLYIVTG